MNFVYYEGRFLPEKEAHIPLTDRGLLFGDGVYATIQVRDSIPLFLETHLERLSEQCQAIHLALPFFEQADIFKLIERNQAQKGIWKLKIIITGGDEPALYLPKRKGRIFMTLHPFHGVSQSLKLGLFSHPFYLCHASYKSLAHLNRLYVMQEARDQGVDDCITLTQAGVVLETAFGNLCWVIDKKFYTPHRKLPLYFGVTITKVIAFAKTRGYEIEEVEVQFKDLPKEAIYFRTNSMGGVCPIVSIAGEKKRSAEHPLFPIFESSFS
ncbi:MAG: aminotransferase class IV [Chlamydiales bacterium]